MESFQKAGSHLARYCNGNVHHDVRGRAASRILLALIMQLPEHRYLSGVDSVTYRFLARAEEKALDLHYFCCFAASEMY